MDRSDDLFRHLTIKIHWFYFSCTDAMSTPIITGSKKNEEKKTPEEQRKNLKKCYEEVIIRF